VLKKIIKRDRATIEDYNPSKLVKWGIWAAKELGNRVDWSGVIMDAQGLVPSKDGVAYSQDLQNTLIDLLLARKDWPHNKMAGRLYVAQLRKEMYDEYIPTVYALHSKLRKLGLMKELNYTEDEYRQIETIIKHERDFNLAHFQVEYSAIKYGLKNLKSKERYESPQFIFMRLAMHLAEVETGEKRMLIVKDIYDELSEHRINPPTPALNNLGTNDTGLASCCLYKTGDTIPSIEAGDSIAYLMTAASAGIGGLISTRSINDPVRSGKISHQGKLHYLRAVAGAVKANKQGSRGGAITSFVPIFDPEIEAITVLQGVRTPTDKQNRDVHIAIMANKFLTQLALDREQMFLFNCFNAPDLYEAFFSKDQELFPLLYRKYENDEGFKKVYVDAYETIYKTLSQSLEVGTLYEALMDEINRHTPHLDPIHSSNLCLEITQPTYEYESSKDLYAESDPGFIDVEVKYVETGVEETRRFEFSEPIQCNEELFRNRPLLASAGRMKIDRSYTHVDGQEFKVKTINKVKVSPEVSLCSLAAIVTHNVHSDEQYEKSAYYSLYIIDRCIDIASYPLPHIKYTSIMRRNAGVGVSGVATVMARLGLTYDSIEGRNQAHIMAERHSYFLIKAAITLGEEKGNAPWMHKTLWPQGWLPIDTYKKTVDELVTVGLKYDWEEQRERMIKNGGIRFSSLVAHMPLESSSKSSGGPNSLYAIRDLAISKTDGVSKIDWTATDSDLLADKYQIAWNIESVSMIKYYAVWQKFGDQAISADLHKDRRGKKLQYSEKALMEERFAMVRYGLKTRYYQNILTDETEGRSTETEKDDCAGGACKM
jgi:ribonucleoside-diphosphate reductase alpha chain